MFADNLEQTCRKSQCVLWSLLCLACLVAGDAGCRIARQVEADLPKQKVPGASNKYTKAEIFSADDANQALPQQVESPRGEEKTALSAADSPAPEHVMSEQSRDSEPVGYVAAVTTDANSLIDALKAGSEESEMSAKTTKPSTLEPEDDYTMLIWLTRWYM